MIACDVSPVAMVFFSFFRKMKESGQLDRIIRKWDSKPSLDCWGLSEFKSMGMENTAFAFVFIVGFVCVAAIVFLLELGLGKCCRD